MPYKKTRKTKDDVAREKGLEQFVEYLNEDKNVLHKVLSFEGVKNKIEVDIAMQYTDTYSENIVSFVNNPKRFPLPHLY